MTNLKYTFHSYSFRTIKLGILTINKDIYGQHVIKLLCIYVQRMHVWNAQESFAVTCADVLIASLQPRSYRNGEKIDLYASKMNPKEERHL